MSVLASMWDFPLLPRAAGEYARRVDMVFAGLMGFSALVTLAVLGALVYFSVKYRAGSRADRGGRDATRWKLETVTFGLPLVMVMGLFVWASWVYFQGVRPPRDAMTVFVVAKQWMWKLQHPQGRREIDELHVPVGVPVKLVMTSQDVIHSFYLPAMRVKMDVLPGRYTTMWFEADRPGVYRLFCAEYCGTDHSRMTGRLVVMSPADYARWLVPDPAPPTVQPVKSTAQAAFVTLGCYQCHRTDTTAIAPSLEGLFGRTVELSDGTSVVADEQYIRESIIDPAAKVVRGYPAIMPSYRGLINEDQLRLLVMAVKAMGGDRASPAGGRR